MHSKFSTLWMFCNAYDDMSNFSARSKHQRCYRHHRPPPWLGRRSRHHPCVLALHVSDASQPWSILSLLIPQSKPTRPSFTAPGPWRADFSLDLLHRCRLPHPKEHDPLESKSAESYRIMIQVLDSCGSQQMINIFRGCYITMLYGK